MDELLGGRHFGEVYVVQRREDLHAFLLSAVEMSGARLLYASPADRAPVYLGLQLDSDEVLGLLVYPFRMTRKSTKNRPADEVRGQLRYGSEESWERAHPVSRDIAGVDVTVILGIDLAHGLFMGLDPQLWDPLPMGISFYMKDKHVRATQAAGWHVWEKVNRPGAKRASPRSATSLEAVIAFAPDRLTDYVRLERRASALRLDPALRFAAASAIDTSNGGSSGELGGRHSLEKQFALSSTEILDIIGGRHRLAVAVRGGVAEYHLERQLQASPHVASIRRLDTDAMHDFDVTLSDGRLVRVECKNASPVVNRRGDYKVEVQKTRSSKNDPASRYYRHDTFDVVAACLFSATGEWRFVYQSTSNMKRHATFADRLQPIQVVTSAWPSNLTDVAP